MLRTYAIYGRSLVAAGIIALFLISEFVTKLVSIAFRSLAAVAVWGSLTYPRPRSVSFLW